jgi:hypothetical protein
MEKDYPGDPTGQDADLDAFLSAADRGMLDAIRDNLDLDTGLAQILGNLAGITPADRATGPAEPTGPAELTGPAEAEPGGYAHSYGHALDPVLACEVAGAARKVPVLAGPRSHGEALYHHRALITLALAIVTALNIAVLFSLSQNHGDAGSQSGASASRLPAKPITGEPARDFFPPPRPRQAIVLVHKTGAPASLRFAADSAGIGGDPVISYLRDSRSGPVLLLSGFPAGTAIRFLSIDADRPRRDCFRASYLDHPFPSGGEQFSPGTMMCIAGGNGRVVLKTVQSQSSGPIGVIITWFPDLV